MSRDIAPKQVIFDPTMEIFATDKEGTFEFPLLHQGEASLDTQDYDEVRFVVSLWSPSAKGILDFDRAYAEIRGRFNPEEEHWVKLAEVEPLVPPYGASNSFDGWLVLPVLAASSSFALVGSGFEARSRLQIRVSAYFVA